MSELLFDGQSADGNSNWVTWRPEVAPGTNVIGTLRAWDDFGGGTLVLQSKANDGTGVPVGGSTLTAADVINFALPAGSEIRASLSGSSSPSLSAEVE